MQFIRHTLRRHRNQLKMIGWAVIGFVLIFCVLTAQLSATEIESSRRPSVPQDIQTQAPAEIKLPADKVAPPKTIATPVTKSSPVVVDPGAFKSTKATPISHKAGIRSVIEPEPQSESVYESVQMIPDHATALNTETFQQGFPTEAIYHERRSMPRSNYFGADPDQCCDEWSGFCGCTQKPFDRKCKSCGSKRCSKR